MKRLVDFVRADRKRDVSIYYTDRPSNDFSALFTLLGDANNAESPVSAHGPDSVFLFACGNTCSAHYLQRVEQSRERERERERAERAERKEEREQSRAEIRRQHGNANGVCVCVCVCVMCCDIERAQFL